MLFEVTHYLLELLISILHPSISLPEDIHSVIMIPAE